MHHMARHICRLQSVLKGLNRTQFKEAYWRRTQGIDTFKGRCCKSLDKVLGNPAGDQLEGTETQDWFRQTDRCEGALASGGNCTELKSRKQSIFFPLVPWCIYTILRQGRKRNLGNMERKDDPRPRVSASHQLRVMIPAQLIFAVKIADEECFFNESYFK